MQNKSRSTVRDMTSGPISRQLIFFALPLMLGNVFQMLYNTVDSIVVGNFVGTQALAAVGSTTMVVNMFVFFFGGFSIGAGVVIGNCFGAGDREKLHRAIEVTMTGTFLLCILFTIVGLLMVEPMLHLMSTPEDVFPEALTYLRIYVAGLSGLLIYNMGSGILRAVGDSTRPLYFLILTSLLNIVLDLVFVLVFRLGIAGVAYATILAQFVSAFLILRLLTVTDDIYKLVWSNLGIDWHILGRIFAIGLPAGIQSVITAFSNVFVQGYINHFGSTVMAGWSCYNKLDQFLMLPTQSMAMSSTTFVSQNVGAGKMSRANQGTFRCLLLTSAITLSVAALLYLFAAPASSLFTPDPEVIVFSRLFLRTNVFFMVCNSITHVLAGALRGRGDSRGPMVIMLCGFVVIRQTYLYLVTHYVANVPQIVGFGYPVGWMSACVLELTYFALRWKPVSSVRQN